MLKTSQYQIERRTNSNFYSEKLDTHYSTSVEGSFLLAPIHIINNYKEVKKGSYGSVYGIPPRHE
jgi:hypothetical protein